MEVGQIVRIVSNRGNRGNPAYKNFDKGIQRLYKVLWKSELRRGAAYCCSLVTPDGRRLGSWEYWLEAEDIVESTYKAKPLVDWM